MSDREDPVEAYLRKYGGAAAPAPDPVQAYLQKYGGAQDPPAQKTIGGLKRIPDMDERAIPTLAQGVVPFADELRAAFASIPSLMPGGKKPGEAYRQNLTAEREAVESFTREKPGTAMVGQVGAGIASAVMTGGASAALRAAGTGGGAVARVAATPVRALGRVAQAKPTFGNALLGGVGAGAAYGAGADDENRLRGAVEGGAAGAVAGGALKATGALLYEPIVKPIAARVADAIPGLRAPAPRAAAMAAQSLPSASSVVGNERGMVDPEVVADALRRTAKAPKKAIGAVRGAVVDDQQTRAADRIRQALERANMTADDLAARAKTADPQDRAMDLIGQPAQRMARGEHAIPSKGSALLEEDATRSLSEQEELVEDLLFRTTGLSERPDVRGTLQQIDAAKRAQARELYGAIQDREVANPAVGQALRRPAFQKAYQKAVDIRENEITEALLSGGEAPPALPSIDDLVEGRASMTLGTLDQIKRGLDDVIYSSKREGLGKQQIGSLEGARHAFVRLLDDAVPEYKDARSAYAGHARLEEAMEFGRNLLKMDTNDARAALAEMGQSERDMAVKGGVSAVMEAIEGVTEGGNVTKRNPLAKSTRNWNKLRLLFGDDDAFKQFEEGVERMANRAQGDGMILGGSQTARIEAEKDDAGAALQSVAQGNGIINALLGAGKRYAVDTGLTRGLEAQSDAVAPLLTARGADLENLVETLRALEERTRAARERGAFGRRGASSAAGLVIGGS